MNSFISFAVTLNCFQKKQLSAVFLGLLFSLTAFAFEKQWQFGSEDERDGDGGFVLTNTSRTNGEWSVAEESLRFVNRRVANPDQRNFTEATATIDLAAHGFESGMDFTAQLDMSFRGVWEWNRFGVLALAPDMRSHAYADGGNFMGGQIRVGRGGSAVLAVANDFGGQTGQIESMPLDSRLGDGRYTLTLSGRYQADGGLELTVSALKQGQAVPVIVQTRSISEPPAGLHFGFGGRLLAHQSESRQPVIDLHSFRFVQGVEETPSIELSDPVTFSGTWGHNGVEHDLRVTVRKAAHEFAPLPTAVYLRGLPVPRIGTDSDEILINALLDDGLVVIELDCSRMPTDHEALVATIMDFNRALLRKIPALTERVISPDESFIYWIPEGYRLARNQPFWNIARHGAHGTLEHMVQVYNRDVVNKAGVAPIETPDQLAGPDGEPLDFNLHIDLIYPSGNPFVRPPVIAHFSTLCRQARHLRGERAVFPITWLTSGYALAYVDHIYNPLARESNFGYFNNYSLQNWNALAASSAAMRFLRANADTFNLGDRIGALGHSKSSFSVMRIADTNHPYLAEHSSFDGFPEGSPEPQPWSSYDSRIQVAYASMGLGIARREYTTDSLVPVIVAVGRRDQWNYWDRTVPQVAQAERLGINQLSLWMGELGHDLPFGRDHASGQDRTQLVRRFFDQHLHPREDRALQVLAITPADGAEQVALDGSIARFGVPDEQLPADLHGLSPRKPITVRFARSIDTATMNPQSLQVVNLSTGQAVAGQWRSELRNSRFSFEPASTLSPTTEYRVEVRPGLRDIDGVELSGSVQSLFTTLE